MIIEITPNPERGGMYWGMGPLPSGMTIIGVIQIEDDHRLESGALLQRDDGLWFLGGAGCIRSLPQRETSQAFLEATTPEVQP